MAALLALPLIAWTAIVVIIIARAALAKLAELIQAMVLALAVM